MKVKYDQEVEKWSAAWKFSSFAPTSVHLLW